MYLFYGIYTGSITFDTHIALNNTKAKIKYIKIDKSAKNYLDFQLATMSGYLIAKNKDTNFIIVSRDNGFNSVVDFWSSYHSEKKPITITRQIAIAPTDEMLAQEEQRHTSPARAPRRGRSGSFRSRRSPRTTETAVKETSAKDIKEKEETAPAPVTTPTHSNAVPHEPVVSTPVQKSAAPEQAPVIEKPATKESVSKTTVPAETEKKSSEPRSLGPRAETRLQPVAAAPTREKEVPAAYTRIGPVIPAPSHTEPAATKPVEPKAHDSAVAYARLTPVAAERKNPNKKRPNPLRLLPKPRFKPRRLPQKRPKNRPCGLGSGCSTRKRRKRGNPPYLLQKNKLQNRINPKQPVTRNRKKPRNRPPAGRHPGKPRLKRNRPFPPLRLKKNPKRKPVIPVKNQPLRRKRMPKNRPQPQNRLARLPKKKNPPQNGGHNGGPTYRK